jgi:hypothetical protein
MLAVPSSVAAITHIYEHGPHHADRIITDLPIASSTFVGGIDLASQGGPNFQAVWSGIQKLEAKEHPF